MLAPGAQPIGGAAQIAAIPPRISAGPPCGASVGSADLTHSPAPPTARPPAAGMAPTLQGATGAPIEEASAHASAPRLRDHARRHGMQLKRLRNRPRISAATRLER